MSDPFQSLSTALDQCGLVAILRGIRADEVEAVGDALVEAGIVMIEVPLNSPDPLASIARLATRYGPKVLIGARGWPRARKGPGLARRFTPPA